MKELASGIFGAHETRPKMKKDEPVLIRTEQDLEKTKRKLLSGLNSDESEGESSSN